MSATIQVRVDADIFEAAKSAGAIAGRSAAQQVGHWVRIGREFEMADLERGKPEPTLRADPATALDAAVGPFYDTAGLSRWLGVSRQAIHKRIGKSLLAVHAEKNDILYPAFQFTEHGGTVPHLMDAARTLSTGLADEWSVALWLNTPVDDLAGRSIVECLRAANGDATDGGVADVDAALALARAEASRLAV
ncbi:hypothetical protein E3T46_05755 [Cryobacterium sp. Hh11]|uniref:TA system antitoxin ParD family protein n=1 Tax=Cryobacterium sp. Hh11 TaxID=2555868 RepID=UPI0010690A75|nr:hypothetical protein [Cryobacterium sp. Hh11]TFD52370.1 hypothetical protein E3T46_05755 [Cryobacterium sp. Hh11]